MSDPRATAVALGFLQVLFMLRVTGQLLVVSGRGPRWLPPMRAWQSGLLPYQVLLASQLLIAAVMTFVASSLWFRRRVVPASGANIGRSLLWFSYAYAGGMLARYVIRMAHRPDQRWFGGTIPIAFHLVLAGWLFVFGRHVRGTQTHRSSPLTS
jgi:hypothetical protein